MSEILLPEDVQNENTENAAESQEEELKFQPTEADEEMFFLMYHYNWAPSEVMKLNDDYRKWLIARTFAQKEMEREAMQRMKLMSELGPDLKGPGGPKFTVR